MDKKKERRQQTAEVAPPRTREVNAAPVVPGTPGPADPAPLPPQGPDGPA